MPVQDLIRPQLQSDKEFTDQNSSHFKLCMAVNFKSLWKKSTPSLDFPFGANMTKLKLFHVVKRKLNHARQAFRDKLPFVNSMESLIFDSRKILLPNV